MYMIFNPRIQVGRTNGRFPIIELYIFRLNENLSHYSEFYPNKRISNIIEYLDNISNTVGCRFVDYYNDALMKCMKTENERFNCLQRSVEVANWKQLQRIKKAMNRYFNEFKKENLESEI